jgi:hypothetical protein
MPSGYYPSILGSGDEMGDDGPDQAAGKCADEDVAALFDPGEAAVHLGAKSPDLGLELASNLCPYLADFTSDLLV